MNPARGYIAIGEFNGHRVPQHIQNQIVKTYCDANNLKFVLSRAEYWINGSTDCQLWAALKEGFQHIVFYKNKIILHFAVEQIRSDETNDTFTQFETLIKSNLLILNEIDYEVHLNCLTKLLQQSGDNI